MLIQLDFVFLLVHLPQIFLYIIGGIGGILYAVSILEFAKLQYFIPSLDSLPKRILDFPELPPDIDLESAFEQAIQKRDEFIKKSSKGEEAQLSLNEVEINALCRQAYEPNKLILGTHVYYRMLDNSIMEYTLTWPQFGSPQAVYTKQKEIKFDKTDERLVSIYCFLEQDRRSFNQKDAPQILEKTQILMFVLGLSLKPDYLSPISKASEVKYFDVDIIKNVEISGGELFVVTAAGLKRYPDD